MLEYKEGKNLSHKYISMTMIAQDQAVLPQGIRFPSGEEIYDMIMQKIEPELTHANLPHLDEPYANETEAAHKTRYARYSKAFAAYKVEYKKWVARLHEAVAAYQRAVTRAAEGADKDQEEMILKNLEDQIHSL